MKFKPGDRVVLVHDDCGWGREGTVGTVLEYPDNIKVGWVPFRHDNFPDYSAPNQYHGTREEHLRFANKLEQVLK